MYYIDSLDIVTFVIVVLASYWFIWNSIQNYKFRKKQKYYMIIGDSFEDDEAV
jgi:hypothetical protein